MDPDQIDLWDHEAAAFDDDPDHGLRDPGVHDAWRELLADLLPPPPARIADLGCGTGTLATLLAEEGHTVDGIDFAPEMVRRAVAKTAGQQRVTITLGDASEPPLGHAAYDVVLCRHVLWALPAPLGALLRWRDLLAPGGRLVLIEGAWSTGVGLTAEETQAMVEGVGLDARVVPLADARLWGRPTDDERYVVVTEPLDRSFAKQRHSGESR